jgi:hypothetical protein
MNRLAWLLVLFLATGSIILGLLLGYTRSQETDGVVSISEKVKPLSTLPAAEKEAVKTPYAADDTMVNASFTEAERGIDVSEKPYELDQYAIDAMTDARLNGDQRAPPIGQGVAQEGPTDEELESPELYLEYESRQEKKIYRAYVEAADIKIELLEEQIAKAKERGLPEEELQVGIEKVQRIKQMKA